MLSIAHIIRWPVTILVFSRDIMILIICTLLYATGTMRVFRPSWFGKANTAVQILSVPLALIYQINFSNWARLGKRWSIYATVALTTISGVHYVLRLALDLRVGWEQAGQPRHGQQLIKPFFCANGQYTNGLALVADSADFPCYHRPNPPFRAYSEPYSGFPQGNLRDGNDASIRTV